MVSQQQDLTNQKIQTSRLWATALTGGEIYETGSRRLGMEVGDARKYRLLPSRLGRKMMKNDSPYWRLEFHDLDPSGAYGIDLIGDIVLGRGTGVDIDFDLFDGRSKGVSRQHVILRPSGSALYIIDLESTNGTRVNGLPLGRAEARQIADGNFISLGRLTFTLRVVDYTTLGELRQQFRLSDLQEAHQRMIDEGHTPSGDDEETLMLRRSEAQDTPEDISLWMSSRFARLRQFAEMSSD